MDTNNPPIISLIKRGTKSDVQKYVRNKGKQVLQDVHPIDRQTVLHVAAEEGKLDIVQWLVEKYRLDVNAVDNNGWTPMHSAAKGGHPKIVKYLLEKGGFGRAVNNEGSSPLHYFVRNTCSDDKEFNDVITSLIQKGCIVDLQNTYGESPLHQAAMRGRDYCVLILLNNQANPNLKTKFGETALHFAVRGGHIECINILLNFGADPFIHGDSGSVFELASKFRTPSIRNLLRTFLVNQGKAIPPELEEQKTKKKAQDSPETSLSPKANVRQRSDSEPPKPEDIEEKKSKPRSLSRKDRSAARGSVSSRSSKASENSSESSRNDSDATPTSPRGSRPLNTSTGNTSSDSEKIETLDERIERLKNRVQHQPNLSPNPTRKRVSQIAKNFEGSKEDMDVSSRLEKLKRDVSNVINMEKLEEKVSRLDQSASMDEELGTENSSSSEPPLGDNEIMIVKDKLKNRYLLDKINDGWKCKSCKRMRNTDAPQIFFCSNPHDFEDLDDEAKQSRAKVSADLCSIDNQRFFVRALVEIPINSEEPKTGTEKSHLMIWGVWVQLDARDFFLLMEKWNDDSEMQLKGTLNNIMPEYENTLNQPVMLTTRKGGMRPLVTFDILEHPLAQDQKNGISWVKFENLVDTLIHSSQKR